MARYKYIGRPTRIKGQALNFQDIFNEGDLIGTSDPRISVKLLYENNREAWAPVLDVEEQSIAIEEATYEERKEVALRIFEGSAKPIYKQSVKSYLSFCIEAADEFLKELKKK